jgi:UDP-N-acetyl-D-mannosaminuronic acid dehydrogenase
MHHGSRSPPAIYDSDPSEAAQREAITDGRVPVAVYGLGKMGLPLAAVFADVTGNAVGVDVDSEVVDAVTRGDCPVDGEPGLADLIRDLVDAGDLTATTEGTTAAERSRVHVVIVPTLLDGEDPDLSMLIAAVDAIGAGLDAGDLVCIESTVPPGTCRDVVAPRLAAASGLDSDAFGLAFCPERTASGRALRDIRGAYPKVVGGRDEASAAAATRLYEAVTDAAIHAVSDATTAECIKVFEGVYRDVNIALANELATLAPEIGVDVYEAIEVANTQPYCDIHEPGPGVGGHCIPYYPYFLTSPFATTTPLLERARQINDDMPTLTAETVVDAVEAHGMDPTEATVAVLGLAYRPDVAETRKSPGIAVLERLRERGVDAFGVDPVVDATAVSVPTRPLEALEATAVDALVLVTYHDAFRAIDWDATEAAVILDGRNRLEADDLAVPVVAIGEGVPEGEAARPP